MCDGTGQEASGLGMNLLPIWPEGGSIHRYLKRLARPNQIISLHRSAGKPVDWDGNSYTIEELTEKSFGGVDIALFSAGGSISKKYAHIASDAGCTVRPV